MSEFDPLFSAAEQKYGLPPGILKATAYVESKFDPSATSPTGVRGLMQINGANAKHYGGNRLDPAQSVDMAGRLWSENMKATGGDIDASAVRYNGGGDPHYVAKLHGYLSQQGQAPSDPIEAALTGGNAPAPHPAAPVSNDPIELALSGAHGGGDATPLPHGAVVDPGNQGGGDLGLHAQNAPGRNGVGDGAGGSGGTDGLSAGGASLQRLGDGQAGGPDTQGSQGGSFLQGLSDFGVGTASGIGNVIGTGAMGIGWGLDKLGVTTGAVDKIDRDNAAAQDRLNSHMYTPEGWAAGGGRLTGNIAATLPVGELQLLKAAPESSAIVRGLAKYGNYGVQGAAAGAVVSGGHDVGANIIEGAALGPVGGAVGEHILGPIASKAKSLAAAIRGATPEAVADAAPAAEASAQTIRRGNAAPPIDTPAFDEWAKTHTNAEIRQAENAADPGYGKVDETGALDIGLINPGPDLAERTAARAGQSTGPSPSPADLAKGLKAAGARSIQSHPAIPQSVADDVAASTANGIDAEHALNGAAIRYTGGKSTVGTETRAFEAQQAEREGAKEVTPEGAALRARAVENNDALHNTTQATIDSYGGTPAEGEVTNAAVQKLNEDSKAKRTAITAHYKQGDEESARAGNSLIDVTPLRQALDAPGLKNPTVEGLGKLASGARGYIDEISNGTNKVTATQAESIRQVINDAWDNTGGAVNGHIGRLKGILDQSMDAVPDAAPSLLKGRQAHKDWAKEYEDPEGLAKLIRTDSNGNFKNEDNWRQAERGLIGTANDRTFLQTVRQLKTVGAQPEIDGLKAEVVQRAFDKAKVGPSDEGNKAVFSANKWHDELNKIGMKKLEALFSPEEIGHLKTIGHAAKALHEAVPGSANFSNTNSAGINSALAKALAAKGGTAPTMAGKAVKGAGNVAASLIPHGHVLSMAFDRVGSARSAAAVNKDIAKAIRHTLDPAAARTAANENAVSAAAKSSRKDLARGLARHTAPAAAASQRNR